MRDRIRWLYIKWLSGLLKGVQLQDKEILLIYGAISQISNCRMLVFGMGNDSALWERLNWGGETCFIEDDIEWHEKALPKISRSKSFHVQYPCKYTMWRHYLRNIDQLTMDLPTEITESRWDVILVDGPCGALEWSLKTWNKEPPGRMASIYYASKLVKPYGHVFVHDIEREAERIYSKRFLGNENIVKTVAGRSTLAQFQLRKRIV